MQIQSLGWEDPLEGHGNPLQYSCLEDPMDSGAWQATVHGVTESDTIETTQHTKNKLFCGENLDQTTLAYKLTKLLQRVLNLQ